MLRSFSTRFAGLVILIGGIWGGLIPFVGPYFHFTLGPDHAWTWTASRLYLDVLPAAAAVLGGLLLLGGGPRPSGRLGALLGIAAGAWFAVGPNVSILWHSGGAAGAPNGTHTITRMLELLTLHTGLGALIAVFAGYALPGFLATRRAAAAPAAAEAGAVGAGTTAAPARVGRRRFGLFGRRRAVAPEGEPGVTRRTAPGPTGGASPYADGDAAPAGEPVGAGGATTREDVPAGRQ